MGQVTLTFNYTGANQTFTVPPFVERVIVKAWGAGGGNGQGQSNGGPGGYTTGTLPVSSGQVLNIMVGQGGLSRSTVVTYGGGGAGGNDSSASNLDGASGGGRSGVSIGAGNQLIIAGGGGGGAGATAQNVWCNGGAGGGLLGIAGWVNANGNANGPGKGGTQAAGGAGGTYIFPPNGNGVAGTALQGGAGGITNTGNTAAGGGGGGGYYGGGGGAGQFTNTSNPLEQDCAGGGGSAFIDATVLNGATFNTAQNTNGAAGGALVQPPNTTDGNYVAGRGVGASGLTNGGNGLVVLIYNQPDLILNKSVSSSFSDVNTTLNYTITVRNSGSVTLTNVVFVDTVPTGVTFVTGSLSLNGGGLGGTPNPPGITIPSIAPNATSTVQFSAITLSTPPNPNRVSNVSTASYTGGFVFNSNSVVTTINNATLKSTKVTNKFYAFVGDTITYSIALTNTGSTTANNIIFLDTIPTDTTFVSSSLKQDTTSITGTPNPPGIILPNAISPGVTSTVTFQVTVATIPSPNIVQNSANQNYSYIINPVSVPTTNGSGAINTNIVTTTIYNAKLALTKSVDKAYSICGGILTYTITMVNNGNTTAANIIFKDTISNGLSLIPNSVNVNGTTISGANPLTGVTIPNILPNGISTITFNVQVNC